MVACFSTRKTEAEKRNGLSGAFSLEILRILDLEVAIAQSDTWYKDIYKVGAKTAEDIERKLRYFGFPGAGEDEGQLK